MSFNLSPGTAKTENQNSFEKLCAVYLNITDSFCKNVLKVATP
jgi:hypothetical protein